MVQLLGATLADRLLVRSALRKSIFGLGEYKTGLVCQRVGLHPFLRVKDLTESQINQLARVIERDPDGTGAELQRKIGANILHLKKIGTYRGERLAKGYPNRGQRTHTNANTAAYHFPKTSYLLNKTLMLKDE